MGLFAVECGVGTTAVALGVRRVGVEALEDQRTSTSPEPKDLDDARAYVVLPGGGYCDRCDLLVGLDGLRVIDVARDDHDALTVTVESESSVTGCRLCGVVAHAHGRVEVRLVDAPAFGRPVRIVWRKRRWVCPEARCPVGSCLEQDETIAAPRSKLTVRAARWTVEQIRREHASVNGAHPNRGCSRGLNPPVST